MCFQIRAQQVSEKHRWDAFDPWVWGIADPTEGAGRGNLAAGSYLVMWERNGGETSKHNQIVITQE